MGLTREDTAKINELAKEHECVKNLYEDYMLFFTDPSLRFYKSLIECTNVLSAELDAIHNGKFNRHKILDADSTAFKRTFQILAKSKNILDGIEKGKQIAAEKSGTFVQTNVVKDIGKMSGMSLTDAMANEKKTNQIK